MEAKELLQNLVYLDEVYKRINDGTASLDDYLFKQELIHRVQDYERQESVDLSDLIESAKKGEFCPALYEKLK